MDKKTLDELIDRISSGEATDEELAAYNRYLNQATDAGEDWNEQHFGNEQAVGAQMLNEINNRIGYVSKPVIRLWPRIAAAASIILAMSFGGYWLFHKSAKPELAQTQRHDIAPGRNQATLTLANGKKIILTKSLNGSLAQLGGVTVKAISGNAITYTGDQKQAGGDQVNTMTTARGETSPYPLTMSDGTKVWLNAASSISFPTAFNGKERLVKLTGEAYFEVAHRANQPFKVQTGHQTIEDIGTSFDVNAYADEPVTTTTLIEGSVKVNGRLLKPGQQAAGNGGTPVIREADTEGAIAWKNNYFKFDNENLQSILRDVSRWYNVDIVYAGGKPVDETYYGTVSRFSNLSKVLDKLALAGSVRFSIDGHTVKVAKKESNKPD